MMSQSINLFLITFGVILLSFLGLAVGVMLGRAPLRGSCGGLGAAGGSCSNGCDQPCPRRQRQQAREQSRQEAP